jgi:hypothetical protein
MSPLASRTLRTTAAAAGMAALGAAGFTGTATAAPAVAAPTAAPQLSPALAAVPSANRLVDLPSAGTSALPRLPMLFKFEAPSITTAAAPQRAAVPVSGPASSRQADAPNVVRVQNNRPEVAPRNATALPQQIAALSGLATGPLTDTGLPVPGLGLAGLGG